MTTINNDGKINVEDWIKILKKELTAFITLRFVCKKIVRNRHPFWAGGGGGSGLFVANMEMEVKETYMHSPCDAQAMHSPAKYQFHQKYVYFVCRIVRKARKEHYCQVFCHLDL